MKFSEFKRECRTIMDRIGKERFMKIGLMTHDVGASSQFAHVVRPAACARVAGKTVNILSGRRPATLATVFLQAADAAKRLGGDPEMAVDGDRRFMFGYDSQAGRAIASYDFPEGEGLDESILDAPKPEMDPAVWKEEDGAITLTDEAERVIAGVCEWAFSQYGITRKAGVHVVGSIASNSYSDGSDVDVHFYGNAIDLDGKTPEEFNRDFRREFRKFAEANPAYSKIGGHPIEVYVQRNRYQDMMSVGCYDVLTKTWEVGPDVKDTAFDPYSEYYDEDMDYVGDVLDKVRIRIMSLYEKSTVYMKASDPEFKERLGGEILAEVRKTSALFKRLKKMRKAVSQPRSAAEALKKRQDRKWHIADSAFKLLDKFGYMNVCWTCQDLDENGDGNAASAARRVLQAISDGMAGNANLAAGERSKFGELALGEADGIGGIPLMRREDAEADIKAWAEDVLDGSGADARVAEVWLHGSRMRGGWKDDSDLDAVVFYVGSAREDSLFGILNGADAPCDICGVRVDFNPVRIESADDIAEYKERSAQYDAERLQEGVGSALRSAALAGAMLVPGLAGAGQAKDAAAPDRPAAVSAAKERKYGELSRSNMTNLLATIAYNEAMTDWMKDRNDDKLISILNVVDNRAGKKPAKYADVVSRKSQFFSAKSVKGGYTDATYVPYDPEADAEAAGGRLSPRQKECWSRCLGYARDMLDGRLPSKIGNRNMIANKKKDDPAAWKAWGSKCDLTIGEHSFGYDPRYDPRAGKSRIYTVMKGDTLWGVAKKNGTTVAELKAKNGLGSDVIRRGQKLKI